MNTSPTYLTVQILSRRTTLDPGTIRRSIASGTLVPDALAEAGLRRAPMPLFRADRVGEIASIFTKPARTRA